LVLQQIVTVLFVKGYMFVAPNTKKRINFSLFFRLLKKRKQSPFTYHIIGSFVVSGPVVDPFFGLLIFHVQLNVSTLLYHYIFPRKLIDIAEIRLTIAIKLNTNSKP